MYIYYAYIYVCDYSQVALVSISTTGTRRSIYWIHLLELVQEPPLYYTVWQWCINIIIIIINNNNSHNYTIITNNNNNNKIIINKNIIINNNNNIYYNSNFFLSESSVLIYSVSLLDYQ